MRHQIGNVIILLAGVLIAGMSTRLAAQENRVDLPDLDPDIMVDLHTGVLNYLKGKRQVDVLRRINQFKPVDPDNFSHYNDAIEIFTSVLDRDPGNSTALLFRALCRGRIGLEIHKDWFSVRDKEILGIQNIINIRDDPTLHEKYEKEMALLDKEIDDASLDLSKKIMKEYRRNDLDILLSLDEDEQQETKESLTEKINRAIVKTTKMARREQHEYKKMLDDLQSLVQMKDTPNPVIRLLQVISLTKVARIDEEEAVVVIEEKLPKNDVNKLADELREASKSALDEAIQILESLRASEVSNDTIAIRAKFFLGVVRFRQAVPRQADNERSRRDKNMLNEAKQIMLEIVNDDRSTNIDSWKSYAALYLGLILPIEASMEPSDADKNKLLEEADDWLERAVRLNRVSFDEEGNPKFYSDGLLVVVSRQKQNIEEARTRPPVKPQFVNDLRFTLSAGIQRDSNVVLLGERTDLPRNISDKDDFGFRLGFIVDHTLDLALFDSDLEKWTLGLRGRTSQLWHSEIDTFDEQNYGGSIALQYELVGEEDNDGPVYAQIQYDFDYTLLGRQPFISTNSISTRIRAYWDERRGNSDVYFHFEIRDYSEPLFDRRFNRDGHYFRLGVFHSHKAINMTPIIEGWGMPAWGHPNDTAFEQDDEKYESRYFTPFVGFEYGWDSTAGDEFDLRQYKLTLGAITPLPYGWQLDTTFDFSWEEYLADGSLVDFHRRSREDFVQRYEIGLSRTYVLREGSDENRYNLKTDHTLMTIRGFAAWTLDDSNVVDRSGQAIFEYDRVVYGINVAFSFN